VECQRRSIELSTDVKHGGSSSLKASGRTSSWNGPVQNLVGNGKGDPKAGKTYGAATWVMFNGDETVPEFVTFKLSVQWNDGESDKYDNVSEATVKKGEWTKIEGDYTINEAAVFDKGIQLYVETTESAAPMVDFYIDDVSFTDPEPSVSLNGSDSLFADFENGEASGWTNRGDEKVSVTQDVYRSGNYSIVASGRTQAWNGPKHTLMGVVNYEKTYSISGYVMYNDGPDTMDLGMSIEKKSGEDTEYINIGSVTAVKGKWALIQGDYTVPFDTALADMALFLKHQRNWLIFIR
jgi:endo-1,4-beta-xylanase